MVFSPAPEYQVFPTRERPLKPYEAAVRGGRDDARVRARVLAGRGRGGHPHVRAGAGRRAGGRAGRDRRAACVPGPRARSPAVLDRSAACPARGSGALLWGFADRAVAVGLEQGRTEYNDARARLGLAPLPYVHTGLSRSLTMVATLPQLEYPREWPSWCRVVGPLLWEPGGPLVSPVAGTAPVVLVAPSTSQDPTGSLVRACLDGLADEPVRVIAIGAPEAVVAPPNAVVVPWMSYARTMPRCDLVITHGGHGTLARALVSGCPVVVVPGRRRHGGERRAGRLGGRGCAARAALLHAVGRAARGAPGARRDRSCVRGRRPWPRGRSRIPVPPPPRTSWSAGRRRWAWLRRGRSRRRGRCGRVRPGVSTDEPGAEVGGAADERRDRSRGPRRGRGVRALVARREGLAPGAPAAVDALDSRHATDDITRKCTRHVMCRAPTDGEAHTRREPPGAALVLARGVGLEPTTLRLTAECSAD